MKGRTPLTEPKDLGREWHSDGMLPTYAQHVHLLMSAI